MLDEELLKYIDYKYGDYYHTVELEDIRPILHWTKIDFLYGLYDELMAQYPQRITKQTLGYAYNLEGEIDENYPVYEYTITPIQTTQLTQDNQDTTLMDTPVILCTSGVHGVEKAASYGLYQVFKQLLENPRNHQRVHRMQSTFTFKVIPIVTPSGYNLPHRNNSRGININRNFGYGEVQTPYSEVETQILSQWLADHQGSFAFIDFHNFVRNFLPDREHSMSTYHASPNAEVERMFSEFVRKMSPTWRDKYLTKYKDEGDIAYGFIVGKEYDVVPTAVNDAYYKHDYQIASLIESSNQDPDDLDLFNTRTVLEFTVDIYMNYLLELTEKFG